jgi:putative transcriptional regulator
LSVENLAPGFLVAMPQLGDPNFHRSVVLMIEHGDGGSMGLVINRAAPLTLKDLAQAPKLEVPAVRRTEPIYVGGPVDPQRGFVLHDSDRIEEKLEILPGLFLSVTVDALNQVLLDQCRFRFCLGFSGWAPQQLEQELTHGSWLFTEAEKAQTLETDPSKLWDLTVRGMGFDPAMLLTGKGIN